MKKHLFVAAALGAAVLSAGEAKAQIFPPQVIQKSLNKSLPLLQTSAGSFQAKMGKVCFSCHHQSLPSLAYANAAGRGFNLNETARKQQSDYVYAFAGKMQPLLTAAVKQNDPKAAGEINKITVDPTISLGYLLFGLNADGRQPDETLGLATEFLARKQEADGRWPVFAARPPMEGSEFTTTALAVKALNSYGAADYAEASRGRIERARTWLTATRGRSTEDKAFRLLGLKWSGAGTAELEKATRDLLDDQRDDGGWAQLTGKGSDAYATGQALIALHDGGGIPVSHGAFSRGTVYLLITQQQDGSWRVPKRTAAAQQYFDTSFPHGKDQFISVPGTAWATAALALSVPEQAPRTAKR